MQKICNRRIQSVVPVQLEILGLWVNTKRMWISMPNALWPSLITLCLNPVACKLRAAESYRLPKQISAKIIDLLYIDDLKISASSEGKLGGVMEDTRDTIKDIGSHWNEKRFAVAQVKQGCLQESERMKVGESKVIDSLKMVLITSLLEC